MNNSGVVVGPGGGGSLNGYRWQQGGAAQSLSPLSGDHTARPQAINILGQIAGSSIGSNGRRPATWLFTTAQSVGVPSDGTGFGEAWGINDSGEVVGEYYSAAGGKPFLWRSGVGAQALPLPDGITTGTAWAINSAGIVIGYAGPSFQPVVWRKTAAGAYEVVWLENKLTNGTGWSRMFLAAINESGQIAGEGRFNGSGRGFLLTPGPDLALVLRTDADRSGVTDFDTPADATVPGRPFYFWTNDDNDATGEDLNQTPVDSADDRIMTPLVVDGVEVPRTGAIRDLEDFARLAFKLTPELQTAIEAGAKLSVEARGAGTIHLFATPSSEAETRYLTDAPFAISLITADATNVALPSRQPSADVFVWEGLETLITPADWSNGRLRFLWEGVTPGACILTLKLTQSDGTELISDPVHFSLRPVRDFFTRVRVTPRDGFPPPWETNGQTPSLGLATVHSQAVTPLGEQNVDLVWVHGWRLTEFERQNWGEIMFKRLWHARFMGRLHAFTWPTLSGDDAFFESGPNGLLSFDRSEFRAWKAGTVLHDYLHSLRSLHQGGRLGIVAHSMGNIVSGEALRLGAPADIQIMLQAAVSAGCYDNRIELENADLVAKEKQKPTPDSVVELGYRGFLGHVSTPTINYYNTVDFALNLWFRNQLTKPDNPVSRGGYEYRDERAGFYSGKTLLREVTDVHESLAFLARARSLAVGAEPRTGMISAGTFISPFTSALDLQAVYGFSGQSSEHSAEFNRSIQQRLFPFYLQLRRSVTLVQ